MDRPIFVTVKLRGSEGVRHTGVPYIVALQSAPSAREDVQFYGTYLGCDVPNCKAEILVAESFAAGEIVCSDAKHITNESDSLYEEDTLMAVVHDNVFTPDLVVAAQYAGAVTSRSTQLTKLINSVDERYANPTKYVGDISDEKLFALSKGSARVEVKTRRISSESEGEEYE
jgi:hypothetical protein